MNLTRQVDLGLTEHSAHYRQLMVLLGARQVGKTTILRRLFPDAQYLLMDNEPVRRILERYDINAYRQIIDESQPMLILDEVHLLSDPGRAAKIIYDQIPGKQLIIAGSSAFNIKSKTTESLAGRKIDYHLYPLTFSEYLYQIGMQNSLNTRILDRILNETSDQRLYAFDLDAVLSTVLVYGTYPDMVNLPSDRKYLLNLVESVVFKDLLELKLIENQTMALAVLKLLAYQIGNLVNYTELAGRLGIDVRTVKRYIDIFEQSFLIYRLYPFATNHRDEIGKTPKIYFHDLGLRNALIGDFGDVGLRSDRGALFENFIIGEIYRINTYLDVGYRLNYWRLKQGAEIDLVLSRGEELIGVEITYTAKALGKSFLNRYPRARLKLVTSSTFY